MAIKIYTLHTQVVGQDVTTRIAVRVDRVGQGSYPLYGEKTRYALFARTGHTRRTEAGTSEGYGELGEVCFFGSHGDADARWQITGSKFGGDGEWFPTRDAAIRCLIESSVKTIPLTAGG